MGYFLVFVGAGIGGALRHGVNVAALRMFGSGFPVGTLFVNVAGSLIMGIAAEYWAVKSGLPQPVRLFLTTGVLGGFTTFSTFSLDAALLWERGSKRCLLPPTARRRWRCLSVHCSSAFG